MYGRVTAAIVSACILGLIAAVAAAPAAAGPSADSTVVVAGNRRVDAAMIRSHFRPAPDGRLDAAALDAALKSLYATGLFQDVRIARNGERLLVTVVENPT